VNPYTVNDNSIKQTLPRVNEDIVQDTFTIKANYRDPFLGNIYASRNPIKKKVKKPLKKVTPKSTVNWSQVTYQGMVKNQKTKDVRAMLKINGQDQLMTKGNEADGFKLMKIYGDSVQVLSQKELKYIRLNKSDLIIK